ncbi:hypothetical protein JTE90_017978 [Oedothorax gibbosus]|uniref:Protein sleepless n=1 Tax=Oedothorax gibbosus TaxID=931172 RepID=A0AAV6V9A9_9ARAC|nr:hypothetical protein JTE90_017978 [Oedothorax gibbosus]
MCKSCILLKIFFNMADPRRTSTKVVIYFIIGIFTISGYLALDCFKCMSTAGSYPPCDDPFHNNYTRDILETPCWAGRKQRNGVFPATSCVKLAGVYADNGQTLVVRGCAVDSGTLTIDTELVRMSHCGGFYYEDRYVRGCVQNCLEDGCNKAEALHDLESLGLRIFLLIFVMYFCKNLVLEDI